VLYSSYFKTNNTTFSLKCKLYVIFIQNICKILCNLDHFVTYNKTILISLVYSNAQRNYMIFAVFVNGFIKISKYSNVLISYTSSIGIQDNFKYLYDNNNCYLPIHNL